MTRTEEYVTIEAKLVAGTPPPRVNMRDLMSSAASSIEYNRRLDRYVDKTVPNNIYEVRVVDTNIRDQKVIEELLTEAKKELPARISNPNDPIISVTFNRRGREIAA